MKLGLIIAFLHLFVLKQSEANKPRSVNLALETVLEFNNNDKSTDVKMIDNVQSFLNKIKKAITDKRTDNRRNMNRIELTFTDFLKHLISILKSYDDDDLLNVIDIFNDEIKKHHYRGCKFYELIDNREFRRTIADKLNEIKSLPAEKIRLNLDNVLSMVTDKSAFINVITNYLDSLYAMDQVSMTGLLDDLSAYRKKSKRSNLDIVKIIKSGIRNLIFDNYSKMDVNQRKDVKIKIESLWREFVENEDAKDIWRINSPLNLKSKDSYNSLSEHTVKEKETTKRHRKRKARKRHKTKHGITNHKTKEPSKPKLTFITLYPETITLDPKPIKFKKHKHSNHKKGKKYTKHSEKEESETKEELYKKKATIDLPNSVEMMEDQGYTSKKKKMRFKVVRRSPSDKKTTTKLRINDLRRTINFIDLYQDETDEIKTNVSINNEKVLQKEDSLRKSNFNITVSNKSDTTRLFVEETTNSMQYIKKIDDLEKELNEMKALIKRKETKNTIFNSSIELPHYDVLNFWEGTTKFNSKPPAVVKTEKNPIVHTTKAKFSTINQPDHFRVNLTNKVKTVATNTVKNLNEDGTKAIVSTTIKSNIYFRSKINENKAIFNKNSNNVSNNYVTVSNTTDNINKSTIKMTDGGNIKNNVTDINATKDIAINITKKLNTDKIYIFDSNQNVTESKMAGTYHNKDRVKQKMLDDIKSLLPDLKEDEAKELINDEPSDNYLSTVTTDPLGILDDDFAMLKK